jgi:hypothetical protein|tara:strand:- start:4908 stop:5639 length:732 start_codon:yes stop_codon:yes gene_type:complete
MNIEIPVLTENVIIRLSGGADSALLLYMICDEYEKAEKPLNIWPITVLHGVRNWQSYHAQQVIDWMTDKFPNVNFMEHEVWRCDDPGGKPDSKNANNYVDYQEKLIDGVVSVVKETCAVFNGVTANPPEDIGQKHWGSSKVFGEKVWDVREKHRDWHLIADRKPVQDDVARKLIHVNPFIQHHKGHVAELYYNYELVDTLLPITRSCEGWDYMTEGFSKECGECWWCMERDWAFNVHNKESTS